MKPLGLAAGLLVSTLMHLVLFLFLVLVMDTDGARVGSFAASSGDKTKEDEKTAFRTKNTDAEAAVAPEKAALADISEDAPPAWLNPVLPPDIYGPAIDTRSGRLLRVNKALSPVLTPPRLIPYKPVPIKEKSAPKTLDVLNRTRPASYEKSYLEEKEDALRREMERDLADCRLDEMPLVDVILKWRYLRLQKLLFQSGLEPDFAYDEMRRFFMEKLRGIRRSLADVPAEDYFQTLLYEYRKNKIYEEKRGHSLFNAIYYDIYNCRTGTEELAMYLSLFHPDLELGISRGSIVKFDGSLIGHVDPTARINGQWMVFKTVSRAAGAYAPYEIGELFPIEKLILDYLPGFDAAACRLNRPLARNGEEIDDSVAADSDNLHPLIVKHDDSRIVLLRETFPQPENFPMITREDRLFREMRQRYRDITGAQGLLHSEYPYLDFIFHLQSAQAADRRDLVRLYLKNRMDTDPPDPKRTLRIPDYLPGYQDLVRTLFSTDPEPEIEIVPGRRLPIDRYLPHKEYIEARNRVWASLEQKGQKPKKKKMPEKIAKFLLFSRAKGVHLVSPPDMDVGGVVTGLLDDAYELTPYLTSEAKRRKNNTSARRIAILKTGLMTGDATVPRRLLEKRIGLIHTVLEHGSADPAGIADRQDYEPPGRLTFGQTVAIQGRSGLSPGFVKDMVELMGEADAVSAFARYLNSEALETDRGTMLEMLAYMDRYLLYRPHRQRLVALARDLLQGRDLAIQTAAAQFLANAGVISARRANMVFLKYLERHEADAVLVASMLHSGLDKERAARLFARKIDDVDLGSPDGHRRMDILGRIARVLDDPDIQRRVGAKHTAFVAEWINGFHRSQEDREGDTALVLNSLTELAHRRFPAPAGIFDDFVTLGADNPEALFMAEPMGRWIGRENYFDAVDQALDVENDRLDAEIRDLERLRAGSDARQGTIASLPAYGAALAAVRDSAARIAFLSALSFQNGFGKKAYEQQERLLRRLFAMEEFQNGFEKDHSAGLTLERNRILNHEKIYRPVELTGFLAKALDRSGTFNLNHAPFIQPKGEYMAPCGPTRRTINSKSAPKNFAFTPAGIYFIQLLDTDNTPEQVAAAFTGEQRLLRTLSDRALKPERAEELDQTRDFFQGMARSEGCDIRRIYVFEKLLRQNALPEELPSWVLAMAWDSHEREKRFLRKMEAEGGARAVLTDYRRMTKQAFAEKWGESPFSIRNLYATLFLVKAGLVEMGLDSKFVASQ